MILSGRLFLRKRWANGLSRRLILRIEIPALEPNRGTFQLLPMEFLPIDQPLSHEKYRELVRHSTITLARYLMVAPMVLTKRSVITKKAGMESIKWLIENQILTRKETLVKTALEGCIDWGWQSFEVVYKLDKNEAGEDPMVIHKLKPLRQEITYLRANPYTGDFAGACPDNPYTGGRVSLTENEVMHFSIDERSSNWYSNFMLDNCIMPYEDWQTLRKISMGYLRKVAGAHWTKFRFFRRFFPNK